MRAPPHASTKCTRFEAIRCTAAACVRGVECAVSCNACRPPHLITNSKGQRGRQVRLPMKRACAGKRKGRRVRACVRAWAGSMGDERQREGGRKGVHEAGKATRAKGKEGRKLDWRGEERGNCPCLPVCSSSSHPSLPTSCRSRESCAWFACSWRKPASQMTESPKPSPSSPYDDDDDNLIRLRFWV